MNVKRFFAKNSRDALGLVRNALGAEAVILSNKSIDGGCEILAVGSDEMAALVSQSSESSSLAARADAHNTSLLKSNRTSATQGAIRQGDDKQNMANRPSATKPPATQAALQAARPKSNTSLLSRSHAEDFASKPRGVAPETSRLAEPQSLAEFISKNSRARDADVVAAPVQAVSPIPRPAVASAAPPVEKPPVKMAAPVKPDAVKTETLTAKPELAKSDAIKIEVVAKTTSSARPPQQSVQEMTHIMSEMRTMRGAIESQLSELVWENTQRRDPIKSVVLRNMLTAGFSPGLSRQLAEKLPVQLNERSAINWAKSILENNLDTMADESEILDKGGIFALIGPTGVGKTTTTAKLAARYVMKHGTNKLALITTDAYRIGGHEQLRIYGKILGVMVHAVKDEADLKIALEELKGKHTILIDTVGMNQRDEMVASQIGMLSSTGSDVKRLLCLNATSNGETLTDVVRAYKGKGLAGCIMTKLDEAATIGNVLDVMLREKLKLYYVANGQRVPEDIHIANAKFLIHHAFKLNKRVAAHAEYRNEELPLLMAHAAEMTSATSSRELSLG